MTITHTASDGTGIYGSVIYRADDAASIAALARRHSRENGIRRQLAACSFLAKKVLAMLGVRLRRCRPEDRHCLCAGKWFVEIPSTFPATIHNAEQMLDEAIDVLERTYELRKSLAKDKKEDVVFYALRVGRLIERLSAVRPFERAVLMHKNVVRGGRQSRENKFGTDKEREEEALEIVADYNTLHRSRPSISKSEIARKLAPKYACSAKTILRRLGNR